MKAEHPILSPIICLPNQAVPETVLKMHYMVEIQVTNNDIFTHWGVYPHRKETYTPSPPLCHIVLLSFKSLISSLYHLLTISFHTIQTTRTAKTNLSHVTTSKSCSALIISAKLGLMTLKCLAMRDIVTLASGAQSLSKKCLIRPVVLSFSLARFVFAHNLLKLIALSYLILHKSNIKNIMQYTEKWIYIF